MQKHSILALFAVSVTAQNLRVIYADQDCGINSVDDATSALQACIDNSPDYQMIVFPPGLKPRIGSTVKVYGRYGLRFEGLSTPFIGPSMGKANPGFIWIGADGGLLFDVQHSQGLQFRGLSFASSPSFTTGVGGAATLINDDNARGIEGPISTRNTYDNLALLGTQQNPNFRAILFAANSNTNVEDMKVTNSLIQCSYSTDKNSAVGQGIVMGPNQNEQKHHYEGNQIINCSVGIFEAFGGYGHVISNSFNNNGTDIFAYQPYGPFEIRDNDSENHNYFFRGNTHGGVIENNRIATPSPAPGEGAITINNSGGTTTLIGNHFDGGRYIPVSIEPGAGGAIFTMGNTWPNFDLTQQGLSMFGAAYGQLSVLEANGTGTAPVFSSAGTHPLGVIPGVGQFTYVGTCFEFATCRRWMATENGGPPRAVLPWIGTTNPTCRNIGDIWFDTTTSPATYKVCLTAGGQWTIK